MLTKEELDLLFKTVDHHMSLTDLDIDEAYRNRNLFDKTYSFIGILLTIGVVINLFGYFVGTMKISEILMTIFAFYIINLITYLSIMAEIKHSILLNGWNTAQIIGKLIYVLKTGKSIN